MLPTAPNFERMICVVSNLLCEKSSEYKIVKNAVVQKYGQYNLENLKKYIEETPETEDSEKDKDVVLELFLKTQNFLKDVFNRKKQNERINDSQKLQKTLETRQNKDLTDAEIHTYFKKNFKEETVEFLWTGYNEYKEYSVKNAGNKEWKVYYVENKNEKTNDDKLLLAFHGTPNNDLGSKIEAYSGIKHYKDYKVLVPYTDNWTVTLNADNLTKAMGNYYKLIKNQLLNAKEINIAGHSYGPLRAMAFLTAIAEDKKDGAKILEKVKNLHLYNGALTLKSEQFGFLKWLIFLIRRWLCGEFGKAPSTRYYVKKMQKLQPQLFKQHKIDTEILYNKQDVLVPHTEGYIKKIGKVFDTNISNKITPENVGDSYYEQIQDDTEIVQKVQIKTLQDEPEQLNFHHNPKHDLISSTFLKRLKKIERSQENIEKK